MQGSPQGMPQPPQAMPQPPQGMPPRGMPPQGMPQGMQEMAAMELVTDDIEQLDLDPKTGPRARPWRRQRTNHLRWSDPKHP